jgi:hypothetical protein
VRSSTEGYPIAITLHAIGMAVMVGIVLMLDMRLLGKFRDIPLMTLHRWYGIAWLGFAINTISGSGMFAAQASEYVTDITFMSKMTLVFLGAITAGIQQSTLGAHGASWGEVVPRGQRQLALVSIIIWVSAIVIGRLTAYI